MTTPKRGCTLGRPSEDSVRLTVSLRRETARWLKEEAARRGLPVSRVVEELLSAGKPS